jgi:hypothetical protein
MSATCDLFATWRPARSPESGRLESAVQAQLTREVGTDKVALIADSSNREIDRLNARAQHLGVQSGELGPTNFPLKRPLRATARRLGRVHRPGKGRSRFDSTGQTAGCSSRPGTPSRCGSPTPNMSTASRAQWSIVRSCLPAAGKQRLRPSDPSPPRHRLVPRSRPTWRRRPRPGSNHTTLATDGPKPCMPAIHCPPRDDRPSVGPHPRPTAPSAVYQTGPSAA